MNIEEIHALVEKQWDTFDEFLYTLHSDKRTFAAIPYLLYVLSKVYAATNPPYRKFITEQLMGTIDVIGEEMYEDEDDLGSKLLETHNISHLLDKLDQFIKQTKEKK